MGGGREDGGHPNQVWLSLKSLRLQTWSNIISCRTLIWLVMSYMFPLKKFVKKRWNEWLEFMGQLENNIFVKGLLVQLNVQVLQSGRLNGCVSVWGVGLGRARGGEFDVRCKRQRLQLDCLKASHITHLWQLCRVNFA